MELTHLRYMLEIERCGSITKAAATLYMGQPNLSKAVKELERELGITIFTRTAKGAVPTEKGREFLDYARSVIAQTDRLELSLKQPDMPCNELSAAAPCGGMTALAAAKAAQRLGKDALLDMKLTECSAPEAISLVADGSCGVALIRYPAEQEGLFSALFRERGITSRTLRTYSFTVLFGESSPLAQNARISRSQLKTLTELTCGGNSAARLIAERIHGYESRGDSMKKITLGSESAAYQLLSAMPDAYMYSPPFSDSILSRCRLLQRPLNGTAEKGKDVLICRSGHALSDAETVLIEELERACAE